MILTGKFSKSLCFLVAFLCNILPVKKLAFLIFFLDFFTTLVGFLFEKNVRYLS